MDHRKENGTNIGKRKCLELTRDILNKAREFYIDFFIGHALKFNETESYIDKNGEQKTRKLSAEQLLTWAESMTVPTAAHPDIMDGWNFSEQFPGMPRDYRRSVIKDAIGKVRGYLSNFAKWEASGADKSKPSTPGANNHPTLYKQVIELELELVTRQNCFVEIKVYAGANWEWVRYPFKFSEWQNTRLNDSSWENKSPKLILRPNYVGLHISQEKTIKAKKVKESKEDPHLVTVGVDLNVKNLAVVTVREDGKIIETAFIKDEGLDQHRYQHMKQVYEHQWQSGKPVKGEHSDTKLWDHIVRTNDDFAHKASRTIVDICAKYPGCVLIFEKLRKIKRVRGQSKCHRANRKKANQVRGKIFEYSKAKAYGIGVVTLEVNPHGTSQYCSHCGQKGGRFSFENGKLVKCAWGKLFYCEHCHYEANADFNASVNMHHSFYNEGHWERKVKEPSKQAAKTPCSATRRAG